MQADLPGSHRPLPRPLRIARDQGPIPASGKSWTIERVLDFFPEDAYYKLTAMSDRALAYGAEPLSHRFLVLFEAAGIESEVASYLVRSLLSEGRVRYETVDKGKDGELTARLVEREGPTGLIVSTTSVALHPRTKRACSRSRRPTHPEQTKLVLTRLANSTSPGQTLLAGTTSRSGSRRADTGLRSITSTKPRR